jgi:2-polyprenyl-6-methoxyphenol hydroxylase-like FAD-dependent oxidoreductase
MRTQVLVVGAGPVGLTLALELGRRGVSTLILDKNVEASRLPKMERCNARTMEIFRRLGIADRVRAAGLPDSVPMDVMLTRSLADPPLAHLRYQSVKEAKAEIARSNDGTRTLEPYQVISQYTLEPLLRRIVAELPNVRAEFGTELVGFRQDAACVTATVGRGEANDRGEEEIVADYLVGCDGGSSLVRKELGIRLEGQGNIRQLRQALFHCPDLLERAPARKARHYHVADAPLFPFLILQDSTRHWTLHAAPESDAAMEDVFASAIGFPIEFEMLSVNQWTQHLLCAERYACDRVFIAGDAAHLLIPTGGLGMNTGVGDANNLAWKLDAVLRGWGGPRLLESYETERRAVGLRNVAASGAAMQGRESWRAASNLREMAQRFAVEQRRVTEILGIEAGYVYASDVIVADGAHVSDGPSYVPTSAPGARLPHVWLSDGRALHDTLGAGFTLLQLDDRADTRGVEGAFAAVGAPLATLSVDSEVARAVYEGYALILLRPDLHVAWRGHTPPADPTWLARRVTGAA